MDKNVLLKIRIMLAAAALLALTAAKLILPAQTAAVRSWLSREISREYDYEAAFTRLGADIYAVFGPVGEPADTDPERLYSPVTLTELRSNAASMLPEGTVPAAERAAEPEAPEAVAAFLESQAAYSAYTVPEGVSLEFAETPFEYVCPVFGVTSSGFGFRTHPIENKVKFHYGTDFAADSGTDVLAFAYGYVTIVGYDANGYGNYVIISHGDGWQTLYGHCGRIYVSGGDYVYRGQTIAAVGSTGEATGPHLHFELRRDGVYLNPEYYLS